MEQQTVEARDMSSMLCLGSGATNKRRVVVKRIIKKVKADPKSEKAGAIEQSQFERGGNTEGGS